MIKKNDWRYTFIEKNYLFTTLRRPTQHTVYVNLHVNTHINWHAIVTGDELGNSTINSSKDTAAAV